MSIIHNKVEENSSIIETDEFAVSPSTAITSATTATSSTCNTTAATISGTAIWSGTSVIGRVGTLETSYGNQVIRLDSKQTDEQAFRLPWGKVASVSHEELIKYIGERDLRESNELVRTLWDRYQTAVKLIWSEDDEQEK
jgi:hypothetical protein